MTSLEMRPLTVSRYRKHIKNSCTLEVSEDKKYILMKIIGEIDSADMFKYNLEAHALARSVCVRRFLLNLIEARNVNSVIDDYDFAYKNIGPSPEFLHGIRVALLVSPDDHSHDFINILFKNTGETIDLFVDQEEAVSFLLAE